MAETISEKCSCGASLTYIGGSSSIVASTWRAQHKHTANKFSQTVPDWYLTRMYELLRVPPHQGAGQGAQSPAPDPGGRVDEPTLLDGLARFAQTWGTHISDPAVSREEASARAAQRMLENWPDEP